MTTPGLPLPNATSRRILLHLKTEGELTVRELANHLAITSMGVRQHLQQLDQAGLVSAGAERANQGRGRPVRPWKLTAAGHQQFPDAHADTTVELIASVRAVVGESALDAVIEHRASQALAQYEAALAEANTLPDRVHQLAVMRSHEGYMAEAINDGEDYLLLENHCPICEAATACQGFCRTELETFQHLFNGLATVSREEHLLAGARRCCYRLVPLSPD